LRFHYWPLCGPPYQLTSDVADPIARWTELDSGCRLRWFPVLVLFPYATVCARGHFAQDSNLGVGMRSCNRRRFSRGRSGKKLPGVGIFMGKMPFSDLAPRSGREKCPRRGFCPVCWKMCRTKFSLVLCDLLPGCCRFLDFASRDHLAVPDGLVSRCPSSHLCCGLRC